MFRRLMHAYRDEKLVLVMIGVLNIASALSEALALVSVAPLVQAAAEGESRYQGSIAGREFDVSLTQLALFSASLLILAFAIQMVTIYVSARLTSGYRLRTRLKVVRAFHGADWSVQAQEREGWLRTLSTDNVEFAANALNQMSHWLKGVTGLAIFVIGAIAVNLAAAVMITVVLGLVMLMIRPVNKYANRLGQQHAEYNVLISEELATLTMTGRELKAYGVVGSAANPYRQLAREQRTILLRGNVAANVGAPIFRTSAVMLIVAMIAITALRGDGEIASVGLVAVLLYRASNYGTVLVRYHQQLVRVTPIIEQLQEGLDRLWAHQITPGEIDPGDVRSIETRSVDFAYPGQAEAALEDVTLRVDVGEVVGVVGPSGAGKSTLAELLIGLRRPTTGEVVVGDTDMSDITEQARSKRIALVSQNVPLVPGTVADNVDFFRGLDEDAVRRAIEGAGLADVVMALPDGDQTRIGPGARAISGGQAQRIGIARALAGDPSIIILDEPTSALDAQAEHFVTDTIGGLGGSYGVLVIAHRLTTLRNCDRVIVIEDGRITDEGMMTEVGSRNGFLKHALAAGSLH